jgi:hypothetical protein
MSAGGTIATVFAKGTGVWAEDASGEWSAMVVVSAADPAAVSVVRCTDGAELKLNANTYASTPIRFIHPTLIVASRSVAVLSFGVSVLGAG